MSQKMIISMERSLPWEAEIRSYTQNILLNEYSYITGCMYRRKKHITLDGIENQNTN
jgi:hypothetical protein